MKQVFAVNNWSTVLTAPMGASDLEVSVPELDGARILDPTYITIDDEIIKVSGVKQASATHGVAGVNAIVWTALLGGAEGNGFQITIQNAVANQPAAVVDFGDSLILRPAGDGNGAIKSTVKDVIQLVNFNPNLSYFLSGSSFFPNALVSAGTVTLAGGDTTSLQVMTRGAQGTVATAHALGTPVEMRFTAGHIEIMRQFNCSVNIEQSLVACEGTPTQETLSLGDNLPCICAWTFGHSTAQSVSGFTMLPIAFSGKYPLTAVMLFIQPDSGAAGTARFTVRAKYGLDSNPADILWTNFEDVVVSVEGSQYSFCLGITSAITVNAQDSLLKCFFIEITRTPEHADDTFAGDISLVSVTIIESSPEVIG